MEKEISMEDQESMDRIEHVNVEIVASKQAYDRDALSAISKKITQLREEVKEDQELAIKLRESFKLVFRAINQFSALDKMIIVTCGMLKAGKSTMINLLARNEMASPVDFGVDTTLRPAVVRMGESARDGQIYCYYLRENVEEGVVHKSEVCAGEEDAEEEVDHEAEGRRAALRQIFDKLRGLSLTAPEKFSCEQAQLTLSNLHDYLCVERPEGASRREPLLVVVETPRQDDADCLLANGNMLLDMPGLDSSTAKIAKQIEDYAEVVSECDMMFYIQSSVSPLNSQARGLLTKVLKHRHPETVFVIQNCMEVQWWRKPELQEQAQARQAKNAQDGVLQCFRECGTKLSLSGVRCERMNLGMAYDAMVETDDKLNVEGVMPGGEKIDCAQLIDRSRFKGFENEVRKIVREHGLRFRARHCKDELSKRIDELRGKLKTHIVESITPKSVDERQRLDSWKRVEQVFEKIMRTAELSDRPQSICPTEDFVKCIDEEKIRKEVLASKPEYGPFTIEAENVKGSLMDAFLTDCSDHMCNALKGAFDQIALNDVGVRIRDDNQRLHKFMNESLRKFVFDKCDKATSEEKGLEWYFNKVKNDACPGYYFAPDEHISEGYRSPLIIILKPSRTFKKRSWGWGWEVKFGVSLVNAPETEKRGKNEVAKLQDAYCDVAKSHFEKECDNIVNDLFDIGKKKGFERTLTYVKNRINDSSANLEAIRKKQELSERCVRIVTDIEAEIGGVCHD